MRVGVPAYWRDRVVHVFEPTLDHYEPAISDAQAAANLVRPVVDALPRADDDRMRHLGMPEVDTSNVRQHLEGLGQVGDFGRLVEKL